MPGCPTHPDNLSETLTYLLYMATGQIGIFASIFRGGGVLQAEAFYYLTNHS